MLVDLEIIFNNTYGYIQFTYEVPDKYNNNIRIGDIVEIPFRNKLRLGIVLNLESKNSYAPISTTSSIFEKSRFNLLARSLFNINISGEFTATGLMSSLNVFGNLE